MHQDQPTIVKLRVMSRHQQLLRMDFEEPFNTDPAALLADVEGLLAGVKVLVLSDYGKGALKNHQALIRLRAVAAFRSSPTPRARILKSTAALR